MPRKIVILVHGLAHSGKDTFADFMIEEAKRLTLGVRVSKVSNATLVKELAVDFFEWNGVKDTRGRKLLIDITEVGYSTHKFFWEQLTFNRLCKKSDVIVIPDFRYEQTYAYYKSRTDCRVITVSIRRPNYDNQLGVLASDHSEVGLKDFTFDYIVSNDGDTSLLEHKAKLLTRSLLVSGIRY